MNTIRLDFNSDDGPWLSNSTFKSDSPAIDKFNLTAREEWKKTPLLQAFCLLCVEAKYGNGLVGKRPCMRLNGLRNEARKRGTEAKWMYRLFGDHSKPKTMIYISGEGDNEVARLDSAELPVENITITINAKALDSTTEGIRLCQALWRLFPEDLDGASYPGDKEIQRIKAKLLKLAHKDVRFVIEITSCKEELPLSAAQILVAQLIELTGPERSGKKVTLALSGGLLQAFVADEMRNFYRRRNLEPHKSVRVVALNRMNFNDFKRFDRGADFLSFALAKSLSQDPEIFLPPISEVSGLVDPYEDALKEADILLLSGGARSKDSFIGQFLDFHEKTTPEGAIGDLVGHPILADGQDACDAQCREVLNVLRCRPTLDDLEKWSRDRNKHVILLADAIPWRDDDNLPTKARLVLAVLRRGLANQLIISKHLADEVVLLVK